MNLNNICKTMFHIEWEHELTMYEKVDKLEKEIKELHKEVLKSMNLCNKMLKVNEWYRNAKFDGIDFSKMEIKNRTHLEIFLYRYGFMC